MNGVQEGWVFGGMAGKRIVAGRKETPEAIRPRALRGLFSRLAWLSLVGLHPCRAQLRFTRQSTIYLTIPMSARISFWQPSGKIDKSAYRLGGSKIDKSAYRVDIKKDPRFTLDKSESLV
jgi:hypothetical protein